METVQPVFGETDAAHAVCLASHPLWQWREGMLVRGREGAVFRLTAGFDDGAPALIPVITDAATQGILLEMLHTHVPNLCIGYSPTNQRWQGVTLGPPPKNYPATVYAPTRSQLLARIFLSLAVQAPSIETPQPNAWAVSEEGVTYELVVLTPTTPPKGGSYVYNVTTGRMVFCTSRGTRLFLRAEMCSPVVQILTLVDAPERKSP